MKKHIKKKLSRTAVAMLCCLAALTVLSSCDKDLDPWEIVSLEVESSSQDATISHDGGTFTIDVNSNTKWSVKAPEWVTVDKTSGEGKATINVTVDENKNYNKRTGLIQIVAQSDDVKDNVAGSKLLSVTITQDPAIIINITRTEVENIQDGDYIVTDDNKKFYYTRYKTTIEYEVDTNLTDAEIAELMTDPYMVITLNKKWLPSASGSNYTFQDYITINDLPMTRGTHTVTGETEQSDWGQYVTSGVAKIWWTDSYGNRQTAINYEFDVNDPRY